MRRPPPSRPGCGRWPSHFSPLTYSYRNATIGSTLVARRAGMVTSKIAALYVQYFDDQVALQAVNKIENLTIGLSRKIWQKVMIIDTLGRGSG